MSVPSYVPIMPYANHLKTAELIEDTKSEATNYNFVNQTETSPNLALRDHFSFGQHQEPILPMSGDVWLFVLKSDWPC